MRGGGADDPGSCRVRGALSRAGWGLAGRGEVNQLLVPWLPVQKPTAAPRLLMASTPVPLAPGGQN